MKFKKTQRIGVFDGCLRGEPYNTTSDCPYQFRQMGDLAELFDAQTVQDHILPLTMKIITDPVAHVRQGLHSQVRSRFKIVSFSFGITRLVSKGDKQSQWCTREEGGIFTTAPNSSNT